MKALLKAELTLKDTEGPPAILTVEDDKGLLLLIQRRLNREGFHSHGVSEGAEAIKWLTSHACDLLLLDYRLPDMTGEDLIKALQKRGIDIPFIVCTGQEEQTAEQNMLRLGARDYLVKEKTFFDRLTQAVKAELKPFSARRRSENGIQSLGSLETF